MRKNDRGRGLEDVGFGKDFHLHKGAVGQGIDGVDVTAGSAEVADAGAHARAGIFRKDLGRSDEGKSGCATPLFFRGVAFPGTQDILYPTRRWIPCKLAAAGQPCAVRTTLAKSSTPVKDSG
jgi:hypothetical protein